MRLKPFFCYYGGKHRLIDRYPRPTFDTIIEPFAGSAAYATRYYHRRVILCDVDPIIHGVWAYLIRTPSKEILKLPLEVEDVRDLKIPYEAQRLTAFWLNKGVSRPVNKPSSRFKGGSTATAHWGKVIRKRIADQVDLIRHWKIVKESYTSLQNKKASWFVDPPYNNSAGKEYRFHDIDYTQLSDWCLSRKGQVIVCENAGADWLPFDPLASVVKNHKRRKEQQFNREVVYSRGNKPTGFGFA